MLLAWIQRGKTVDNMTLNWMSPQRLLQTQATSFSESERLQIADLYAHTIHLGALICWNNWSLSLVCPSITKLTIKMSHNHWNFRFFTCMLTLLVWEQIFVCKSGLHHWHDSPSLSCESWRLWFSDWHVHQIFEISAGRANHAASIHGTWS